MAEKDARAGEQEATAEKDIHAQADGRETATERDARAGVGADVGPVRQDARPGQDAPIGPQARPVAASSVAGPDTGPAADATGASLVPGAAPDELIEAVDALTYDGDRTSHTHASGAPETRPFVRGDDDPRDAAISERPLTEQTAWTGRIFSVSRLHVELPDGREAVRDVVRHPGAVAVVALTDDGRICLVRQYRAALGRVTVEIPAGKLDPGEDPLSCARRELEEETGFEAERMAYLTTIATSCGFTDEIIHLYMATGLSFTRSSPDADEFINVDMVELSELIDAVLDGHVEDVKTVVGALACDAVSHRLAPEGE